MHSWQGGNIVKFAHHAFQPHPAGHVARLEVDDGKPAARFGIAFGQLRIEIHRDIAAGSTTFTHPTIYPLR